MSQWSVLLLASLVVAVAVAGPTFPRDKRVTDEETAPADQAIASENNVTTPAAPVECKPETPCGWTVYTPFTKVIEYFMKNDYCNCPSDRACNYYDDDISVGAYVHRCQIEIPSTTVLTTTS